MTAFRVMMKAVEGVFDQIKQEGSPAAHLDRMQTRAELYELLQYDQYQQADTDLAARFPETGESPYSTATEASIERSAIPTFLGRVLY